MRRTDFLTRIHSAYNRTNAVTMPVLVQVRDVDAAVRDELKARASRDGVSLNSYLRDLLTQAATTPTRDEVVASILARSERSRVSAAEILRAERDDRSAHA